MAAGALLGAVAGPAVAQQVDHLPTIPDQVQPAPGVVPTAVIQQEEKRPAALVVPAQATVTEPVLPAPRNLPESVPTMPAPHDGPGSAQPAPLGCGAAGSALPATAGDRWHQCVQDCFLGYRSEFDAPPLGSTIYKHFQAQVTNGEAARMVLYHYDFVDGCERLTMRGHDQLAKIAATLPHNFFPIIIERTPTAPGLAEARRLTVVNELAHGPFPVPPERVLIGPPLANGLTGTQAELIYQNLRQLSQRGASSPSVGTGTFGSGAGAAGGGAGGGIPTGP
jgi:hypothetical protein